MTTSPRPTSPSSSSSTSTASRRAIVDREMRRGVVSSRAYTDVLSFTRAPPARAASGPRGNAPSS
ncbi:hypothetical protein ACFQV2_25180 [Actinokineospora soli]|uniref:Uncharacterized protein n=1 Tax=Actinokineospora soli TaxID=1048753 RepID=A0ABW2TSZ9_9PSEU